MKLFVGVVQLLTQRGFFTWIKRDQTVSKIEIGKQGNLVKYMFVFCARNKVINLLKNRQFLCFVGKNLQMFMFLRCARKFSSIKEYNAIQSLTSQSSIDQITLTYWFILRLKLARYDEEMVLVDVKFIKEKTVTASHFLDHQLLP